MGRTERSAGVGQTGSGRPSGGSTGRPGRDPDDPARRVLAAERALLGELAGWATASVALGLAVTARRPRPAPTVVGVARQAVAWGLVDLVVVGWGVRGLRRARRAALDPDTARLRARRLARVTAANAVLDVGYVAAGAALAARVPARRGDGVGIAVQGLALLWLDVRHSSAAWRLSSSVRSGPDGRST